MEVAIEVFAHDTISESGVGDVSHDPVLRYDLVALGCWVAKWLGTLSGLFVRAY